MSTAERIVESLLENDPKDFLLNAEDGEVVFVAMCPFTTVGQNEGPHPEYYSDDLGEWQHDWERATRLNLSDYIQDGVLDENDLPFGTEAIILVNPDGSPGEQVPVQDLAKRFFNVRDQVDTYVSPEERYDLDEGRIDWNERLRRLRIRRGCDPETGEPLPE